MSTETSILTPIMAGFIAAGAIVALSSFTPAALAQNLSPEEIIERLTPEKEPLTRSFRRQGNKRDVAKELKARGIRIDQPISRDVQEELELKSIDITIYFEFNSDRLTNEGMLALKDLGTALQSGKFPATRFQIAGHTDAKGSREYNKELSQRRANAAMEHLRLFYGASADQFIPVGYGEEQLADVDNAFADVNRRVQILNLEVSVEKAGL